MEETAIFGFPFPDEEDEPDGPVQIGGAVKALEARLAILEGLLGTKKAAAKPEPGQLVIVNGTSDPVYKEATGDVAINSNGKTTVGANAITEGKIAAGAVGLTKLGTTALNHFTTTVGNTSGPKVARGNTGGIYVEGGGSSGGYLIFHGLGTPPAGVSVTIGVAFNYVVTFDPHIYEVNGSYFGIQIASAGVPAPVTIGIYWTAFS